MPRPARRLDPASLELLVLVATSGSIRAAAEHLGMTQPGASQRLSALERHVGLTLVERLSTGARLTPDGVVVAGWAEQVLAAERTLLQGSRALAGDHRSHLRLAASFTVAEYLLPAWLAGLGPSAPSVSLRMANSHEVAALFARDEVDLGFVEGPSAPKGLQGRTIWRDRLAVVVAPTHPWARRRGAVTTSELAREPLVLREAGSGTRQVLETQLAKGDLTVRARVELASTTAIKSAVGEGLGPAVLSVLAVGSEIADGRLIEVRIAGLDLTRSIRAVWPRGRTLPARARQLLGVIGSSQD